MLTAVILTPLAGSLIVALLGRSSAKTARLVALVFSVLSIGVIVAALGQYLGAGASVSEWIGDGQLKWWLLELDGLAAPLVGLAGLLGLIATLAVREQESRSVTGQYALVLAVQAAVSGVFLAGNLVLFYVFWEAVLIPVYFLIGIWGGPERRHAAMKYFTYMFAGSAVMLVGVVLALVNGAFKMSGLDVALGGSQSAIFWFITIGFLIKWPVVGLHTWQPDAYTQAPTSGSIMLAGVIAKMGAYGMLRVALPIAPDVMTEARWLFAALGIIGIIYGSLVAMAQSDVKRLVAYSSVAHMGFVLLAVSLGTPLALGAAMLSMVSHGLVAGLLFLLIGQLHERTGTYEMSRMGGFGRTLPGWATAFTFAALASAGLPALSGFPGELATVMEGWNVIGWWIALAAFGVVLAAGYNLIAVRRINHGPIAEEFSGAGDLALTDWVAVAPLALGILVMGMWPSFVTTISEPALKALAALTGGAL